MLVLVLVLVLTVPLVCLDIAEQIYSEMNAAEDSSNADTPLTSRTPSEASGPSSIGTSTGWVENQISKLDGGQC